ncbi:MAG: hypothetical protein ABI165_19905 [Bryobacteraceae bacterium]
MSLVVADTTPLRFPLVEAARSSLIRIEEALERLGKTKFRGTPDLFARSEELARNKREAINE